MTGAGLETTVAGRPAASRSRDVASLADAALDGVVVILATWTVVYHVSLLAGTGVVPALVAEAILLLGCIVVLGARGGPSASVADPAGAQVAAADDTADDTADDRGRLSPGAALPVLVPASLAAIGMALQAPWGLVWVAWLAAGIAGSLAAGRAFRRLPRRTLEARSTSTAGAALAVTAATGLAGFSLVALRPNPDDLFYVNVSQWVATHGTFPVRDTLFSDLRYPMANWPPTASYDALVGAVAHLLGTSAGTIAYLVVLPVATFLAVLALWRLLRAWRTPRVTVALAAALVFLLFDGTSSYGPPGNLFVTRLWQGKVILLCVLVPVLLAHALRYVEAPTRARAGWLFVCGVAAVAMSTTAIFLIPLVALAGLAPLVLRSPRAGLAGLACLSAYPLGAGVVTVLLGGRSADDFQGRKLYRFDASWIGHEVFLTGLLAFVAVAAVLLGSLVLSHPAARVTSAVAVLTTGLVFVPGLTHVAYDLTGLGPTLWRVTWLCTVAAHVGALASWVAVRLSRRRAVAAGVAGTALLAAFGAPVWSADTSTYLASPLHWQRGGESRTVVEWMLAHTDPGDVVLAPDSVSVTAAVTTTEIKTVAPRDYYLDYLRDDPTFHYEERLALDRLVNRVDGWSPDEIPGALDLLRVRVACAYLDDDEAARLFEAAGYVAGIRTSSIQCFVNEMGSFEVPREGLT